MPDHPRICVFCSADCSAVEHVRDRKGRYACAACIERNRKGRGLASPQHASRAAAAAGREPASPIGAAASSAAEIDAGYALDPIPLAPPPPPVDSSAVCPVCVIRMPPDLGRCVQCGYNPKEGIQSSRKIKKKHTKEGERRAVCPKCAYDMTGVPGTRCPECGAVVDLTRRRYDRSESRRIAIWSYLKPAIMLAAGLAGIVVFLLATDNLAALPGYLIQLGLFLPIAVFLFFMCCLMWIGFDAPFHRVTLELTAVYVVVDLIALVIFTAIPVFIFPVVAIFLIYILLLGGMLDLEYGDAAMVAFVTLLGRIATLILIVSILS